jgi:hypothetical protein
VVAGICVDFQSNNTRVVSQRRSIMTSARRGQTPRPYGADMTNITIQAAGSIAAREAILRCVPKAIWGGAFANVEMVIRGDAKTLEKRRAAAIEAFGRIKIPPERIYAALGVAGLADITLDQMMRIKGWMAAIKDGESPETVIGGKPALAEREVAANPLRTAAAAAAGGTAQPTQAATPPPPSNEGAKIDMAENARAEPAQRGDGGAAGQQGGAASDAPGTPGRGENGGSPESRAETQATRAETPSAPAEDAAAYLGRALAVIDHATSASALADWWRRTADEREGKALTGEMIALLLKEKQARMSALGTQATS